MIGCDCNVHAECEIGLPRFAQVVSSKVDEVRETRYGGLAAAAVQEPLLFGNIPLPGKVRRRCPTLAHHALINSKDNNNVSTFRFLRHGVSSCSCCVDLPWQTLRLDWYLIDSYRTRLQKEGLPETGLANTYCQFLISQALATRNLDMCVAIIPMGTAQGSHYPLCSPVFFMGVVEAHCQETSPRGAHVTQARHKAGDQT
jgi:hypothetical protein